MTAIFIAVTVVMVALTGFIAIAIRVVADNADKKIDNYFINKLEEYDDDFRAKMDKIEQLKAEREDLENQVENLKFEKGALETSRFYKPRPVMREVYIPVAHYIDSGFFADYKIAKQMLNMDKEAIIKAILICNPYQGNIEKYTIAKEIKSYLNNQAMYDLITLPGAQQMQVFLQTLNTEQLKLFLGYIKTLDMYNDEFEILRFNEWLDKTIRHESPLLWAYTAQKEDYTYIDEHVRCAVDKNVCDGIRIIYQGKLFDYSIYETSIYETIMTRESI